MPDHLLFVYGTLRGAAKNPQALRLSRESASLGNARVTGRLLLVGRYPGLVAGSGSVLGDLVRLHDPAASLPWLDRYEGAEFRRVKRRVSLQGGDKVTAWCYEFQGRMEGLPRIPSGDFLARS